MRSVLFLLCGLLVAAVVPAAEQADLTQEEIALDYYRPIAEAGEPLAQLTLGEMYFVGKEVSQDLVQSYAWLAVAAHQGVGEAAALLAEVKSEMSPEQLSQGKALAGDYIANFAPPAE